MCRTCRTVTQVHTCHGGLLPQSPCHLHQAFLPMLSLPNLPNRPHCVMIPSLSPCVLVVQLPLMSENMWCLFFCSCVSLLRIMASSFIYVSGKDMISLLFMAVQFSLVYVYHIFFIQSIIDGQFWLVPCLCHCKQCCNKRMCACVFAVR